MESPIFLKEHKSNHRDSEFTYSHSDKNYARTREESGMIQVLPNGILSSLVRCIQSHLMQHILEVLLWLISGRSPLLGTRKSR